MPGWPHRRADAALAAGRVLAWALLIGGWLALAALGRQVAPVAAGLWLPAVWLLGTAAAVTWASRRPLTTASQALAALALAVAAGLATALTPERSMAGAAGLALAWSGLLALAATVVRGLRLQRAEIVSRSGIGPAGLATGRPPLPLAAAAMGTALAWLLLGDAAAQGAAQLRETAAWALPAAALALAALARGAGRAASACRSGLFDCAWWPPQAGELRSWLRWPMVAASLAMLPMMATLPWMADWCGRPGAGPAEVAAQHLAAMLLPALLASALPARVQWPRQALAGLLAGSGLVLLLWPGREGLAAAALLQGLAWSLAWQLRLTGHGGHSAPAVPDTPARSGAARGLAVSALALLVFGVALDHWGPLALTALHGALALAGAAGLLGAIAVRARAGAARPGVACAGAAPGAAMAIRQPHEKGGPQAASHAMRAPSAGTR